MERKKIVVALGGNAIIKKGQKGTVYEQFANTREALNNIFGLIREGHYLVITHGNGPQVGNILLRVEASKNIAYELPLGVCVAQSQGEMGYMIVQSLQNKLIRENINRSAVAILTQVVVDKNDPSMENPTKPIGKFYTKEEAQDKIENLGWKMVEDAGRGWRRVVPSPKPFSVVESDAIKNSFYKGDIVIACGGGGIPVYVEEDGTYEGVDAVVDKDLASSVLANEIGADELIILTGVEFVYLNFGRENEKRLENVSLSEIKKYYSEGHFPEGNMGPKIEAVINFLENGGKKAIITSTEKAYDALKGKTGTHIYP